MTTFQALALCVAALCLVIGFAFLLIARLEKRLHEQEQELIGLRSIVDRNGQAGREVDRDLGRVERRIADAETQLRTAARLFTQQAGRILALEEKLPGRKVVRGPWGGRS